MNHFRPRPQRAAVFILCALCFVLPLSAQTPRDTVRVTLLQVNDVYQISPIDRGKTGGLARLATLRKQVMAESPNTLFLLAGDTLSPSVASNIFRAAQANERVALHVARGERRGPAHGQAVRRHAAVRDSQFRRRQGRDFRPAHARNGLLFQAEQ
jgi:hypothetical protein